MAKKTIQELKDKFKTGNFPTQSDYEDVFDTMLTDVTTDDVKGVGEDSDKTLTQIVGELPKYTAGDGINISDNNVISVSNQSDSSNTSNKKFVEILDDLDGSDAPVNTIAMFGGQTGKYTHGFIYEKTGGGSSDQIVITNPTLWEINGLKYYEDYSDKISNVRLKRTDDDLTRLFYVSLSANYGNIVDYKNPVLVTQYGAYAKGESEGTLYVPKKENSSEYMTVNSVYCNNESIGGSVFYRADGKKYCGIYNSDYTIACLVEFDGSVIDLDSVIYGFVTKREYVDDVTLESKSSWTPLNVMNVIN